MTKTKSVEDMREETQQLSISIKEMLHNRQMKIVMSALSEVVTSIVEQDGNFRDAFIGSLYLIEHEQFFRHLGGEVDG